LTDAASVESAKEVFFRLASLAAAALQTSSQVALDPSLTLKAEASSAIANVSSAAAANEASLKSTSLANSTLVASVNSASSPQSLTAKLATENKAASSETKADAQATEAQETAFNFDAKLAKSDALQNPKVLETAVSLLGAAKTNAQLQQASLTSNGKALGVQAGVTTSTLTNSQISTQASFDARLNIAEACSL